jgi:tRNA A-37 threonylcarbamoyl transferase component Bud32
MRFSPWLTDGERAEIREALRLGLQGARPILGGQSRIKAFYRVETPSRPLFIKARRFPSWTRRLGRTIRETKEEIEFRNFLRLRELGVPCPEPLAAARTRRFGLTVESLLVMEHLARAKTLRVWLAQPCGPERDALLDALTGFLGTLAGKGVVHDDLQWNNVMASCAGSGGWSLYLVDALHVRLSPPRVPQAFSRSLSWFLGFMRGEGAGEDLIQGLWGRLAEAGLTGPPGPGRAPDRSAGAGA